MTMSEIAFVISLLLVALAIYSVAVIGETEKKLKLAEEDRDKNLKSWEDCAAALKREAMARGLMLTEKNAEIENLKTQLNSCKEVKEAYFAVLVKHAGEEKV